MKSLLSVILVSSLSVAQDTVRVMTYNLLAYADGQRDQYFRTVLQSADPDILVVQELDTSTAIPGFLVNNLNSWGAGDYQAGVFVNGPDSDNMIFFRSSKFTFVSNTPVRTDLRDINEFVVEHVQSGLRLRLFAVHLNAAVGDSLSRSLEVDSLRARTNALPPGAEFLVLGDFNIYGSYESAYQKLLAVQPGAEGHFQDVLSLSGVWNNPAYAVHHTQSTRTRAFGFGATGGLDDRFDMILFSPAVLAPGGVQYVPGSLRPFGNDGLHYNDSINRLPNTAVPDSVAHALHYASDHLPVVCELVFPEPVPVEELKQGSAAFEVPRNYPNPFGPSRSSQTWIRFTLPALSSVSVRIYDILGQEIRVIAEGEFSPGVHVVPWDGSSSEGVVVPAGVYFMRFLAGGVQGVQKIVVAH